jgi:hypothetical protein
VGKGYITSEQLAVSSEQWEDKTPRKGILYYDIFPYFVILNGGCRLLKFFSEFGIIFT